MHLVLAFDLFPVNEVNGKLYCRKSAPLLLSTVSSRDKASAFLFFVVVNVASMLIIAVGLLVVGVAELIVLL